MDIEYGPDRRVFRLLSTMKGYDGYMIGKLLCRRLENSSMESQSNPCTVRKQRKNYVILELRGDAYFLSLTMVYPKDFLPHILSNQAEKPKPYSENKIKMRAREKAVASHCFAVSEILDFVQFVQDTNGIHRSENPVVPGLLMAEWFFEVLHSVDWETAEFRFHTPVYADQQLCLCWHAEGYDCFLEERGQLCWCARVKSLCHE